jgi:predicted component of viral defense system (DUF524 family)
MSLARPLNFMKLELKFKPEDFKSLHKFSDAVKRQLGPNVYVGTDSLCFYFDYPKQLAAQLRPFAPEPQQLEFEVESSLPDAK